MLGLAATSVSEGAFLEVLGSDMSPEQQRNRLDKWLKKLPKFTQAYDIDVEKAVHPRILAKAVQNLISPFSGK